ncbi:unnamed protein product [Cunninghamella blakesleeana]
MTISYRWGEISQQLLETPDYIAHITSFDSRFLKRFCYYIKRESDLKEIQYMWIDPISVDQQDHSRKKETILKMTDIYENVSYILAIPDLHIVYLKKNTANKEMIDLANSYGKKIYDQIYNYEQHVQDEEQEKNELPVQNEIHEYRYSYHSSLKKIKRTIDKNEEIERIVEIKLNEKEKRNKEVKKEEELKKAYKFLAYLIDDWSNRAWVISEYHIAKEKYMKHGTPLKYIFISITFNRFVKSRFTQRSHLEMILDSNATRNEDRFNAILPSWDKYKHIIKNKNTVSEWNVTDMTSVRLKLYEIMDLWDKATLLYACSKSLDQHILPSFTSRTDVVELREIEKNNYNNIAYEGFTTFTSKISYPALTQYEFNRISQLINEYHSNSKVIWIENLTSIQLNQHHCYLSVKSNSYFIMNIKRNDCYTRNKLSLDESDDIYCAFIPFFICTLPDYTDRPDVYRHKNVFLMGNWEKIYGC